MAKEKVNNSKGVEESTPTTTKPKTISTEEMVSEKVASDTEEQTEDVRVIVKDIRFTEEPQMMSKSSYEILKSQGIKIELC